MNSIPKQPPKENGKGLGEALAEPVQELTQQGKEKLASLTGQWRNDMESNLGQRKSSVADSLGTVAETLHEASEKLQANGNDSLGSYLRHGQQLIEQFSGYLKEKEVPQIARDVRSYAHRNPTLMVGGLFALGFMAGRFLRSSAPDEVQTKALAIPDGATWR